MSRNGGESSPVSGTKIILDSAVSIVKNLLLRLLFHGIRISLRWHQTIQFLIESLVSSRILNDEPLINFLNKAQPHLRIQKQALLERCAGKKVIYFTFRTLHFIDWFTPIHLAIERNYPGEYEIFYIDFSTSLHRIRRGFRYLRFRKLVEERLTELNISYLSHFSHEELKEFKSFPEPSIHLTCESIRQESFSVSQRIYLPHYALPKATDLTLPKNIRFNRVFLPTLPPYTYKQLENNFPKDKIFHYVGYPKMYTKSKPTKCFPDSKKPVVLYAPSLDLKLIFDALDQGLINIFKKMESYKFVIKLHPSLASRRHYITSFMNQQLNGIKHIHIDELSGIQNLAGESSVMITDFGSVGCEYRLRFGKPVVFLQTPSKYKGGADLRFRDDFADAICNLENLENTIHSQVKKGKLSENEIKIMRKKVLSFTGAADEEAARTINEICSSG